MRVLQLDGDHGAAVTGEGTTVEPVGRPIVTGTEPRVIEAQPVRVTFPDQIVTLNVRAPYRPFMNAEIIRRAKGEFGP